MSSNKHRVSGSFDRFGSTSITTTALFDMIGQAKRDLKPEKQLVNIAVMIALAVQEFESTDAACLALVAAGFPDMAVALRAGHFADLRPFMEVERS